MRMSGVAVAIGAQGINELGRTWSSAQTILPLVDSKNAQKGSSLTLTRADATSCATVTDFEGLVKVCKANEARISGGRRVGNLLTASEDFSTGWATTFAGTGVSSTKTPNYGTAPDGTATATRLQLNKGSGTTASDYAMLEFGTAVNGLHTVWMKSTDSSSEYVVSLSGGASVGHDQLVTGTWKRFMLPGISNAAFRFMLRGAMFVTNSNNADLLIWHPQKEIVTGQSNTNPSEYVSSTENSTGALGVKYFTTTNGNTVSNNVVTEGTGYPLGSAGSVISGELVTNGDFSQGTTGWTAGGSGTPSMSVTNGAMTIGNTTLGSSLVLSITLTAGVTYRITIDVSAKTGTQVVRTIGGGLDAVTLNLSVGANTFIATPTISGILSVGYQGTQPPASLTFDNISVRQVSTTPLTGLLTEPSRANLCTYSNDFSNAAWTKTDLTPSYNSVVSPDGATNATLMTEGSAATAVLQQTISITVATTNTSTFRLKRGNTDWVRIVLATGALANGVQAWFNLATGVVGAVAARGTGSTLNASSITRLGNGFYACSVTTNVATDTSLGYAICTATADGSITRVNGGSYAVYGVQAELGANASSYIPTTTGAVTRAADAATIPTSGNITAAAGSVYVEWTCASVSADYVISSITDATKWLFIAVNSGSVLFSNRVSSVTYTAAALNVIPQGSTGRIAISWGAGGMLVSVNGVIGTPNAFTGIGGFITAGNLLVNAPSGGTAIENTKNLRCWTTQLTAAQLNTLTK